MKLIKAGKNKFAKVDDEDFEWLPKTGWYLAKGYAMIRTRKMVKNWVPTTYSPEQMRKMEIEEGEK